MFLQSFRWKASVSSPRPLPFAPKLRTLAFRLPALATASMSGWPSSVNPFQQDSGSLIVILATDAPLLPHQLRRLAKRASLGMARTGSLGGNGSGDIFLAFSTANPNAARGDEKGLASVQALSNNFIDPLLISSVYATEEAIINSMIAAEDMTGHKGVRVKALPHDRLQSLLKKYHRS